MNHVQRNPGSSRRDDWGTPQYLFDALNAEFRFNLDVCASADNAKCKEFYTIEDDGLAKEWHGVCWCNPPYGRAIGKWVEKAFHELAKRGTITVMLLPARTDTSWFHTYVCGIADIRFIKGRLRFEGAKHYAPFPSMIVVFRRHK